jgi:hypothetical protein
MNAHARRLTLAANILPPPHDTQALYDTVVKLVAAEIIRHMVYTEHRGALVVELPSEVMPALEHSLGPRGAAFDCSLLERLQAQFAAHDVTFVDARKAANERLDAAFRERGFVLVPEVYDARGPKVAKAPSLSLALPKRPPEPIADIITLRRQAIEIPRLGCVVAYFSGSAHGPPADVVERVWLRYVRENAQ